MPNQDHRSGEKDQAPDLVAPSTKRPKPKLAVDNPGRDQRVMLAIRSRFVDLFSRMLQYFKGWL